jgi:hypothetical protein
MVTKTMRKYSPVARNHHHIIVYYVGLKSSAEFVDPEAYVLRPETDSKQRADRCEITRSDVQKAWQFFFSMIAF